MTEPQSPTAAVTPGAPVKLAVDFWRALMTGTAYIAAERASCEFSAVGVDGSGTVCFGLAIALVAVVLYGHRMVAGVFLGAVLFRLSIDLQPLIAVAVAASESLFVFAAAAFLRQRNFDARLIRVADVGALLVAGVIGAATLIATIEMAAAFAANALARMDLLERWIGRWTALSQGVLLAAPLLLTWLARPFANREALRSLAVGVAGALFLALSPLLLAHAIGPRLASDIVVFAFFPIALWAAYRFEPREATLINVFVAIAAIVGQSLGMVDIANKSLGGVLVALHAFIACFALTTLIVSAINVERRVGVVALATSEARFRSLTEMANDWHWEQDADHRFTMVSHGASSIGIESASLIGRRLWELPFEVTPQIWSAHRKVLETGRPFRDFMLTRRLPSGEIRHFLISGDPVMGQASRVAGYRGVVREITAEKWAEEAMRESEQRYASVFFNSSAAIIVIKIDASGGFRFDSCNQSAEALLEIPAHELVGNAPEQCLPDALAGDWVARFKRCLTAEARITEEHELVTGSGSKHVVVTLVPIRHKTERIERIILIAIDLSGQRRVEQRARESEQMFTRVFHASPVPMFVMAYPDERYIEVNDAWTTFFGFSRDEAIGKTVVDLRVWVTAQSTDSASGEAGRRVRNAEQRVRKKSGEVVDALVSSESIDLGGEPRVITTLIDITARKLVERQLRDSERRFRDFAEAAGEYVWEVDASEIYSYVSNRVETVTGFKPEEIIGRRLDEFMPPGEGARVADWVNANRRADHSYRNLEHRAFTKSGSSIWQLVNAVPILDEKGAPIGYRGTALDITERKQALQRIEELATRDPLTGLPNRRQFEEQLVRGTARAQRSGQLLALMFIDLDKFKTVNDTHGHQVGDGLLREVARRLSAAIRKGDTLSRFGGDEFVILLEGLKSPGDAGTVAQKIVAEIGAPCEIEGHPLITSCSIGISVFPNDAADISTLMRHADAAMYAAKAGGRETYRYFSAEVQTQTVNPGKLGFEIRIALDRDEFRLMYQPRVAIADGRITAVQTSLRWRHPLRGLLTAERFVKIAEEAGLARLLGEWTLDRAALQAREWRGLPDLNMPVAVGLAGIHLSPSMIDMLQATFDRHSIDAQGIQIELSETALMRNVEESRVHIMRMRDMRVKVLVEDFGTGFSSAQYLRRLPVTGVKIAPIFVHEIVTNRDDRAIVRGMISMARSLDMTVIAEGVDTIEQLDVLRELGCTEFAGAHFMPAVPPLEFEQRVLRDTNISRLVTRRPAVPK